MKLIHKNSGEFFFVYKPSYTKINGVNGYITPIKDKVFFIYNDLENCVYDDVTDQFEFKD